MLNRWCACALALVVLSSSSQAAVRLPAVFNEHMVLQQKKPVTVWGWADPGEKVTIKIHHAETTTQKNKVTSTAWERVATSTTNSNGQWKATLQDLPAGGPYTFTASASNSIQFDDVYVGEVWLCSGQSNMAMTVNRCKDFEREKASATHPKFRMFTVPRNPQTEPQDDCRGTWSVCNPDTVGGFSATAYFFGRRLHQELEVPIGLINSSYGGTGVESWFSVERQTGDDTLKTVVEKWNERIAQFDEEATKQKYQAQLDNWKERAAKARKDGKKPPRRPRAPVNPVTGQHRPGNLFNGMIQPVLDYTIRGAIWYQGEHNSRPEKAPIYGKQLQALIKDWRTRKDDDFPFLFVQLPNFHAEQEYPVETTGWVTVREQMLKTLAVPKTGMAITTDVGEANDIHPKDKQSVGIRLAQWALATVYEKPIVKGGPIYKGMEKTEGKVLLKFENLGEGLRTSDGSQLRGFAVAGEDRQFVWAKAQIIREGVKVWSDKVEDPKAIRYNWADNPIGNLVNSIGIPASPFRTDEWEKP